MARAIASPKSTGGFGYGFEDQVAASWLLAMLRGTSPLDPGLNGPTEIRFQVRPDGWLLDDLLAEFAGGCRASVSVKSGDVVKAFTLPSDFVHDCWEQLARPGATAFDPDRDLLVLATGKLDRDHRKALDDLLALAAVDVADALDSRLSAKNWTNDQMRSLAESAKCPDDLVDCFEGTLSFGRLLGCIRVLDFHLGTVDSADESDLLLKCRELLRTGEASDAQLLWAELNTLARDTKARAGSFNLPSLVRKLPRSLALKAHPDTSVSWARLKKLTRLWRADLRRDLGGVACINRREIFDDLVALLQQTRLVPVLGESGSGKSALADRLTANFSDEEMFACSVEDITRWCADCDSDSSSPDVEDILGSFAAGSGLIVLDGVERILGDQQVVRAVARVLRALDLSSHESRWRVVSTCQTAAWTDVEYALGLGALASTTEPIFVGALSESELSAAISALPNLAWVGARTELRAVLAKPKILDIIAVLSTESSSVGPGWTGESEVIDWFWERYLGGSIEGRRVKRLLMHLGQETADNRRDSVPLTALDDSELEPVERLQRDGILVQRESVVRFSHDLFADYSRQRFLLGKFIEGDGAALVNRVANPRWHRGIRLLSLHLLEESGDERWQQLLALLSNGEQGGLGADLVLEAIAYTPAVGAALERLESRLSADEGRYLRRFLVRFVNVCSTADPRITGNAELEPGTRAALAVRFRVPDVQLWYPVVSWVLAHHDLVRRTARPGLLQLAEIWIRLGQAHPHLYRVNEMRGLVLELGEEHVQWLKDGAYCARGMRDFYELLLLAGISDPARLGPIARYLAGIRDSKPPEPPASEAKSLVGLGKLKDRWPDGPWVRPESQFQETATDYVGASFLSQASADFAAGIFLALLIEPPSYDDLYGYRAALGIEDQGIQRIRSGYPPFTDFPPAASLLAVDEAVGLNFISRLVNFATDRWCAQDGRQSATVNLKIGGTNTEFRGDENVFAWNTGAWGPPAVSAALMTLEQWLYQHAEAEGLGDETLSAILGGTTSVAMLGVLVDLVLKYPALLAGPLEALATAPDIYLWVRQRAARRHAGAAMIAWMMEPSARIVKAQEWYSQQHRHNDLLSLVQWLYVRRGLDWPTIDEMVRDAVASSEQMPPGRQKDWFELVAAHLNASNFEKVSLDNGSMGIRWVPPSKLVERQAEAEALEQKLARDILPMRCRMILDGETPCDESALVELIGHASELDEEAEDSERAIASRAGVAAVAFLKHRAWLETNPVEKAKCRSWLLAPILNPPQPGPMESRRSVGRFHWDDFSASAVPKLFLANPDDLDLRQAVAKLLLVPHNSALCSMFRELCLHGMNPATLTTLHCAVQVARLRYLDILSRHREVVIGDLNAALVRILEDFVDDRTEPLPPDWTRLADTLPSDLRWVEDVPPIIQHGLDDEYIVSVFRWVGEYDLEREETRAVALEHTLNLANLVSARIHREEAAAESDERAGTQHRSDDVIIQLCGYLMTRVPDDESRERIAAPWLTVPSAYWYWLQRFVESVYHLGLDRSAPFSKEAILFLFDGAFSESGWLGRFGWRHHVNDLACALLGWERMVPPTHRWTEDKAPLIEELRPFWALWFSTCLGWFDCARCGLRLLCSPAAKSVRTESLAWLSAAVDRISDRDDDYIVEVLELVVQENQIPLESETQQSAFDALLQFLQERQNARAMALGGSLARSG